MSNKLEAVEKGVSIVLKNWRLYTRVLVVPVCVYLLIANFGPLVSKHEFVIFIVAVLSQITFTVIAVTTHRMVILGPDSMSKLGLSTIGWREIKFLLSQYVVFIFLIPLIFLFFIPFIGPLAAIVIGAYLFGRMSLVFPSIAIGEKMDFRDSWDATKNHQLLMFITVAAFPFTVSILNLMLNHIPGVDYILQVIAVMTSVLVVASLSVAYQIVMERKHAC